MTDIDKPEKIRWVQYVLSSYICLHIIWVDLRLNRRPSIFIAISMLLRNLTSEIPMFMNLASLLASSPFFKLIQRLTTMNRRNNGWILSKSPVA